MSNGVAPSGTSSGSSTKTNSASASMNRRISHAHAARSTWQPARVAHLTATPPRRPPTARPRRALCPGQEAGSDRAGRSDAARAAAALRSAAAPNPIRLWPRPPLRSQPGIPPPPTRPSRRPGCVPGRPSPPGQPTASPRRRPRGPRRRSTPAAPWCARHWAAPRARRRAAPSPAGATCATPRSAASTAPAGSGRRAAPTPVDRARTHRRTKPAVNATTVTDTLPTVGVHRRAAALTAAVVVAVAVTFAAGPVAGRTPGLPLERVRDVRLPGRSSRFDYQTSDAAGRRLYVAHLGDSAVDVIDLDSLTVVATVPELANVHGVLAVPEIGRVFASATATNELVTLDASSNQVIARTPTGKFPDGVGYDQRDDLVLVSNKNAGSETVLEGRSGRVVRTVQLGHEVGNVAYDPTSGLAYVAVRPPDQVVAFDPATGAATNRIRL